MRLGVCCTPEQAPVAKSAGAEYVELPAGPILEDPLYVERLSKLSPETTNLFFPTGTALYNQEGRGIAVGAAILNGVAKARVRLCVIGSGGARKAPNDKSPQWAEDQFVKIVEALSLIARQKGQEVAPESLNRSECDVFCKLRSLAGRLQEVGVGYTADSYHVLKEWDFDARPRSLEEEFQREIPHAPLHAHLGGLARTPPLEEDHMILAFFHRLKELGYEGRISIEVEWEDFEMQLPHALSATREMWEVA